MKVDKEKIKQELEELDYRAYELERERVRRWDKTGEKKWQYYRRALADVASKLGVEWKPTSRYHL